METILLPAELRFSWWKWIDGHGLSLCTSHPALKDLDQRHKGETHFYLPLLKMVPTSDLLYLQSADHISKHFRTSIYK